MSYNFSHSKADLEKAVEIILKKQPTSHLPVKKAEEQRRFNFSNRSHKISTFLFRPLLTGGKIRVCLITILMGDTTILKGTFGIRKKPKKCNLCFEHYNFYCLTISY